MMSASAPADASSYTVVYTQGLSSVVVTTVKLLLEQAVARIAMEQSRRVCRIS